MSRMSISKIQYGIYFMLLVLCSTCSYPGPEPYPLANPVVFAFNHEINLDSFKNQIASDTLLDVKEVENGYLFYGAFDFNWASEVTIWVNDSLLLTKVNGFSCSHREGIEKVSGKVRFEAKIRARRKALLKTIIEYFYTDHFDFKNQPSFELVNDYYEHNHRSKSFAFSVEKGTLSSVDTLNWSSNIFGDSLDLHFGNGMLQGEAFVFDSTQQLIKKGFYKNGMETGVWSVLDSLQQLQWTELYKEGELQKIEYTSNAHKNRLAALPTVEKTTSLHRSVFFALLVIISVLFYFYFRRFKAYKNPYKGKETWLIIVQVLGAPVFALLTLFLLVFGCAGMIAVIEGSTNWDIPFNLNHVALLMIVYFFGGTIYFGFTTRYIDVLWHTLFLGIIIMLIEEYDYLQSLGVGLL